MIKVTFNKQTEIPDKEFKYAVICAKHKEKWIFCRHKQRTTWEIAGGHREIGEAIEQTAKRELIEETGAAEFKLAPLTAYCVEKDGEKTYGMLFFAEITKLGNLYADSEIGEIALLDSIPDNLTYPMIQPFLYEYARKNMERKI